MVLTWNVLQCCPRWTLRFFIQSFWVQIWTRLLQVLLSLWIITCSSSLTSSSSSPVWLKYCWKVCTVYIPWLFNQWTFKWMLHKEIYDESSFSYFASNQNEHLPTMKHCLISDFTCKQLDEPNNIRHSLTARHILSFDWNRALQNFIFCKKPLLM